MELPWSLWNVQPAMSNPRAWTVAILIWSLSGCLRSPVPRPASPPPTPAPAVLHEDALPPPERLELQISNWEETPSPDRRHVTLTGRLTNRGDRTTHDVSVTIQALDAQDAVVLSVNATPSTNAIAPDGTATFAVTVDNRPEVARYHVEALAR